VDGKARRKLEHSGWTVGDAKDLLDLTEAESVYIDMKLRLGCGLRERREAGGMTQAQVAAAIGSSQSRVARMEAGDPSVSLDLLVRSLLKLGATEGEVSALIRRGAEAVPST
jgi:DNA-binding XRE family transcriptional regulator